MRVNAKGRLSTDRFSGLEPERNIKDVRLCSSHAYHGRMALHVCVNQNARVSAPVHVHMPVSPHDRIGHRG